MRLTRAGITDYWPVREPDDPDVARPRTARELMRFWQNELQEIEPAYTFGDLVALLRGVDDIDVLSPLLLCDVPAFLEEADRPCTAGTDMQPMQFVQVSNFTDLGRYEPDPANPDEPFTLLDDDEAAEQDRVEHAVAELTGAPKPWKFLDATADDPLTGEPVARRLRAPEQHGSWVPPYYIRRDFDGWGPQEEPYAGWFAQHPEIDPARYEGAFALDFTPVSALLHLPLRYNANVEFRSGHAGVVRDVRFATQISITFGEFLQAIFHEIGFFGAPAHRDDAMAILREREEKLDRMNQKRTRE